MSSLKKNKISLVFLCLAFSFSFMLRAESGIYDRIGIITEHGLHGAVPEENIDLFTGNLTLKNLDIHLPGPNGFDLNLWRVYNSKVIKDRLAGGGGWNIQQEPYSWVGFGWSMHMGRLHSLNTESPVIEYPDGRWETAYRNINDNGVTFITRDFAKLDTSTWKLYFKDGTVWTFGALAFIHYGSMVQEQVRVVTKITNTYGHSINISYDAIDSPRMSLLTDSMGRTITFITDTDLGKLEQIKVKNATGKVVAYNYTVDEFNGDYYKLTSFDPPALPAVTYEYGDGLSSNWELAAVNTSYGGRMEYEYATHDFYYYTYVLNTKVVSEKRIKFSSGSDYKSWAYTYPSYYNTSTGTVTVNGPTYDTYATYNAYSSSAPWKIGLLKKRYLADDSSIEEYEWTYREISNTRWYVLNIDMGKAAAPLQSSITRTLSGDADTSEEYLYERTDAKKYGLPTRINLYSNGSLKNYRNIEYYFETHSSFETAYMLALLESESRYNSSSSKLSEVSYTYFSNGAIDSVNKWRSGTTYLTWNYGYSSSNPNSITITIDQPGASGTETMIYKYGVLATVTKPGYNELSRTISSYNSCILSETNQHGGTMSFSYDNIGRITQVAMPSGFNDITASWSTNTVTITQGSHAIIKYWDGMGRDTGYVEQGDGINLYYRKSLDSEGRTVSESKGSTNIESNYDFVLNNAGQLLKITDPRGYSTIITLGSDQKTVTDANSHATTTVFNSLPGLISELTDAKGNKATYVYDGIGRLRSTTFASSRIQEYEYNGLDQAIMESHPETGEIDYAYNSESNLSGKTWGSVVTAYTYNSSNQVLTEKTADEDITYTYDSKGRVSGISSDKGWSKSSITYNAMGAITQEVITIPGLGSKTVSYLYDGNNQLKQVTYPDGKKAIFTNNGLNVPESIAFNGTTLVNAINYGINKQPISVGMSGNGTIFTATYNAVGGMTLAKLAKGSSVLSQIDLGYDKVGNITSQENIAPTPALIASFTYDSLNRLTQASYTPSGIGRANNFTYAYDEFGNMTQAKENGTSIFYESYNSKNQISDFTYDSRGNLTASPFYNYNWDDRNRLMHTINKLTSLTEGQFVYDEKGMRLKAVRIMPPSIMLTAPNGGEEWFIGSTQSITWSGINISASVTIELLRGEAVLGTIAENLDVSSGTYSWSVGQYLGGTSPAGSDYSIRIRTADGAYSDSSDSVFEIFDGRPTLLSPNGGERWLQGESRSITWTGANPAATIALKLMRGDHPLGLIADNLPASAGTYAWPVGQYIGGTAPLGTNYTILITTMDGAYSDLSNGNFEIMDGRLTLVSPNGGESYVKGQQRAITWFSEGVVGSVTLSLYKSTGKVGDIATGLAANPGTYTWTVGEYLGGTAGDGSDYRICVADDTGKSDTSDANFSIVTVTGFKVISPNGGESLCMGDSFPISWVASTVSQNVKLLLYRNGNKIGVIQKDLAPNGSPFIWTVGNYDGGTVNPGNGYQICLRTMDNGKEDYSDANFTLVSCAGLELLSPNGGESLTEGKPHAIKWRGGKGIREIKIEYSSDLGSSYKSIAERVPNDGIYLWQVPSQFSGQCLVRISNPEGGNIPMDAVLECDLDLTFQGGAPEKVGPLAAIGLQKSLHSKENASFPTLILDHSLNTYQYSLSFGGFKAELSGDSALLDKKHQLKLLWQPYNGKGAIYWDDRSIQEDVPFTPISGVNFSPNITINVYNGIRSFRLDDVQVRLAQRNSDSVDSYHQPLTILDNDIEIANQEGLLLADDFESYQWEGNLVSGGWRAMLVSADGRQASSDRGHVPSDVLEIDSMNAISGNQSAIIDIPEGTMLTLSKSISWPEHMPFAVSAKPFAIVRSDSNATIDRSDSPIHRGDGNLDADIREEIRIISGNATFRSESSVKSNIMTASLPVKATTYFTTYYIYSYDGRLLAEYDGNGACTKDYIYHGGKLLAEYKTATSGFNYYTSDQINSTRTVTNGSGNVVYAGVADPFGGMQKEWTTTYNPSLKFSGKEREAGCQADYFGARYYDHSKYRFLSVDPVINKEEALMNPQLWNLYTYCRNSPITYSDPNGTYEKDVHYHLTRYLAIISGFSESDANIIASANQGIDDNPKTSANPVHALKSSFDAQKRAWHFSSNERVAEALSSAFASGDLAELGAALHCFQDSLFAHKKYRESASHAIDSLIGINPDDTSRDVAMAIEMAQGTFDILNQFRGNVFDSINASFLYNVFSNKSGDTR